MHGKFWIGKERLHQRSATQLRYVPSKSEEEASVLPTYLGTLPPTSLDT